MVYARMCLAHIPHDLGVFIAAEGHLPPERHSVAVHPYPSHFIFEFAQLMPTPSRSGRQEFSSMWEHYEDATEECKYIFPGEGACKAVLREIYALFRANSLHAHAPHMHTRTHNGLRQYMAHFSLATMPMAAVIENEVRNARSISVATPLICN